VLFLHGGATTQFMQVPMNLLDDETAAYCEWHLGKESIQRSIAFWKGESFSDTSDRAYIYTERILPFLQMPNTSISQPIIPWREPNGSNTPMCPYR
jgi:hypothetical protein